MLKPGWCAQDGKPESYHTFSSLYAHLQACTQSVTGHLVTREFHHQPTHHQETKVEWISCSLFHLWFNVIRLLVARWLLLVASWLVRGGFSVVKLHGGEMTGYRSIEPNLQADANVYRKSYKWKNFVTFSKVWPWFSNFITWLPDFMERVNNIIPCWEVISHQSPFNQISFLLIFHLASNFDLLEWNGQSRTCQGWRRKCYRPHHAPKETPRK